MTNNIKYYVLIIIATLIAIVSWIGIVGAEAPAKTCPEGSYDIGISKDGEPLCKLNPTGCPYGDSIPMDMCDKFAPKPVEPIVTEPAPETEPVEYGGK
jgi:hypothetical protein